MTNEEKQLQIPVPTFADITLGDVIDIIKPHPYCITPKHIAYAADHNGGMLTEDAMRDAEKYGKAVCDTCRYWNKKEYKPILTFDQHVKDATVLVIKIHAKGRKPSEIPNLQDYAKSIAAKLEELHIDGVVLRDTTKEEKEKKA